MAKSISMEGAIAPSAPSLPAVPTVVIGCGNYSTVAFDGRKPLIVRSLSTQLQPGQHALAATPDSPVIELDGQRWHVGAKACSYNGFRASVTTDKTDLIRLFVAATLPVVSGGDRQVDLVLEHHSADLVRDRLMTELQGPMAFVRNGHKINLDIRTVRVVDEAIGSWYLVRQQISGWALVLDLGCGTWLARVVSQDGETIASATADKTGVYRLATAIAQDERLKAPLRSRGITRPDISAILDGLGNGTHCYENSGIGWGDWWLDYRRDWFGGILGEAKSEFAPHLGRITKILVTGGGAHLVSDLVAGKPGFIVPNPPHLASVIGSWREAVSNAQ